MQTKKFSLSGVPIEECFGKEISILILVDPDKAPQDAKFICEYAEANKAAYHIEKQTNNGQMAFVAMGELRHPSDDVPYIHLWRGCPHGKKFSIPIIPGNVIGIAPIAELFTEEIEKLKGLL